MEPELARASPMSGGERAREGESGRKRVRETGSAPQHPGHQPPGHGVRDVLGCAGSPDVSRPSPIGSLQRSSLNGMASPHSMSSGPEAQEDPPPGEEGLAGRKLVILGIPWETHAETLKTYFSQFGTVQVCRFDWSWEALMSGMRL